MKNIFFINWTFSYSKLFKLQKKIQKIGPKNSRNCRNWQRLLRRSHLIQLLIINEILQFQIKHSIKKNFINTQKIQEKVIFSKLIEEKYRNFLTEQITILLWILVFNPLVQQKRNCPNILSTDNNSKIYETLCILLKQSSVNYIFINQFSNLLNNKYAILSNLSIEKKFFLYWLKTRNKKNWFTFWNVDRKTNLYCRLKKPFLKLLEQNHSIIFWRLKFRKQINKVCLEKLIKNFINLHFLTFIETEKIQFQNRIKTNKKNFSTSRYKIQKNLFNPVLIYNKFDFFNPITLVLKKKIDFTDLTRLKGLPCLKNNPKDISKKIQKRKAFYLKKKVIFYKDFFISSKKWIKRSPKKSYYFFQYNSWLLIALQKKKDVQILQKSINLYAQYYKIHSFYKKFFNLKKGLTCFGWFIIKNSNGIHIYISQANFRNHQYEIKKYLKTTQNQSVDKMIYGLNKKINKWQKFYNSSKTGSKRYLQLNNFLFWEIWYWIKKRHKKKGAKWLYKRYWKNSTSNNWIFSTNNETLIFYKN